MNLTAEDYVDRVLAGEAVAGEIVRDAVRRHRDDLADGHRRGLYFDQRQAAFAIAFFAALRHHKGEWAGQPLQLQPWQQFFIWSIFGWRRADGSRRFRTVYLEVARKNGKTTIAAGIALLLAFFDREPGAEVYTAGTKRDQARICYRDCEEMVKKSPALKAMINKHRDQLFNDDGRLLPLGRDTDSLDGLNVHAAIADELHAWKNPDMWDLLETATGARRQPLMLAITTAGQDRKSLCYQFHEYTRKVNKKLVDDDEFFGLVYAIDDGDDWTDESVWPKANPNLGVSQKLDRLRAVAARAKEIPARLNAFLRLHLGKWTAIADRWLNPEKWRDCGDGRPADLLDRPCMVGLDLASKTDIAAAALLFLPTDADPLYRLKMRYWIPEEAIVDRSRRDRVPYQAWDRAGLVTPTPGAVIDYEYIKAQLIADADGYDLQFIGYDPWGATQIANQLTDAGLIMVEVRQGYASLSEPMKELERLVLSKKIDHGGDPVLAWMADNVVAVSDPAGNIKPDKSKSIEKIDGIVALIMALFLAQRAPIKPKSVYEKRGILEL